MASGLFSRRTRTDVLCDFLNGVSSVRAITCKIAQMDSNPSVSEVCIEFFFVERIK
jgi:hypothetical protein